LNVSPETREARRAVPQDFEAPGAEAVGARHAASPPCFMHEVDPSYFGLDRDGFALGWPQVRAWRRDMRARLVAARKAMAPEDRARQTALLSERLEAQLAPFGSGAVVALYWPINGEPGLAPVMQRLDRRGVQVVLPVPARPVAPLAFRRWRPRAAMAGGVGGIPVPAEGESLVPDLLVVPVVGFDGACHRLGHGAGYYDRTLAALRPGAQAIGVGFAEARLSTIHPQPHDEPMDAILTPEGTILRRAVGQGA